MLFKAVTCDEIVSCVPYRHFKTRHLFYLQIRREILCGYTFCPDEAAISLASLALQAEYSDYEEKYHGRAYFDAEHYLPRRVCYRDYSGRSRKQ